MCISSTWLFVSFYFIIFILLGVCLQRVKATKQVEFIVLPILLYFYDARTDVHYYYHPAYAVVKRFALYINFMTILSYL